MTGDSAAVLMGVLSLLIYAGYHIRAAVGRSREEALLRKKYEEEKSGI